MTVQSTSAITLAVQDMARSVYFYRDQVGMTMLYGGEDSGFTSFKIGNSYLNLVSSDTEISWWGRVIFYVDDVDRMHSKLLEMGLKTDTDPADATWGERYFHIFDPDGHELSFARPLSS